jgi:hypothetical protein
MPRARQRKKNSTRSTRNPQSKNAARRSPSIGELVRRDVAKKIAAKAKQRRAAAPRIPKELERPATAKQREELKQHGFRTTKRGVIVDGPRDKRRQPIKGAKLEVLKGGVIKTSVKQRRDFIYGFTRQEKREFAKNPGAFEQKKMRELEKLFPSLKKARKKQIRLQWGAFQATKDFAPSYFTSKYFAAVSPEEIRKVGKKKAKPRSDKLTGLHIVIHVPTKKAKRGKGRKRK